MINNITLPSIPNIFRLEDRNKLITSQTAAFKSSKTAEETTKTISQCKFFFNKIKLNKIQILIFKIVRFVTSIFKKDNAIGRYLENYAKLNALITDYEAAFKATQKIHKDKSNPVNTKSETQDKFFQILKSANYDFPAAQELLKKTQTDHYIHSLENFKKLLQDSNNTTNELKDPFNKLPTKVQDVLVGCCLIAMHKSPGSEKSIYELIDQNPRIFLDIINTKDQDLIDQTIAVFVEKSNLHQDLAILKKIKSSLLDGTLPTETEINSLTPKAKELLNSIGFNLQPKIIQESIDSITNAIRIVKDVHLANVSHLARLLNASHDYTTIANPFYKLPEEYTKAMASQSVRVTMASVECSKLVKEGGLAEAVYGIAKGVLKQNPDNKVRLIFPLYDILPPEIKQNLKLKEKYSFKDFKNPEHTVRVFKTKVDGIKCYFIEAPNQSDVFNITKTSENEKQSIYGPNDLLVKNRFANFSIYASELAYKLKDKTDILHLHDWHVAGIPLHLATTHPEEWKDGKIPPVLFTFHNIPGVQINMTKDQKTLNQMGAYNYSSYFNALTKTNLADKTTDIFAQVLNKSDVVNTVSERFALEAQNPVNTDTGPKVRDIAMEGKLYGILNGSNLTQWDPYTDAQLKNWVDPQTAQNVDLSLIPNEDIVAKKALAKAQLQKFAGKYYPTLKIDFNKPIVTYIGRYDSYQKGLELLEPAIKEALKQSAQFICMGLQEDPQATLLLDKLQNKYKTGVLFIRDEKGPDGKLKIQNGTSDQPGIGSVVRWASDFLYAPSRYEPCGQVQFEAWLFGMIPIAAKTGGFADTITEHPPIQMQPLPLPEPSKEFTGYLFDRSSILDESQQKKKASNIVRKALEDWKNFDLSYKNALLTRLMQEGRKSDWNTPRHDGLSSINRYRLLYEHARNRLKFRAKQYFDLHEIIDNVRIDGQ